MATSFERSEKEDQLSNIYD